MIKDFSLINCTVWHAKNALFYLNSPPPTDPILMSVDTHSVQWIRRLNGRCLLCENPPGFYDLSFTAQREVWVLYSRSFYFPHAMQLAHEIQAAGAAKILVVKINTQPLGGTPCHRYTIH